MTNLINLRLDGREELTKTRSKQYERHATSRGDNDFMFYHAQRELLFICNSAIMMIVSSRHLLCAMS